jgi:hypothetical protein
VRCFFCGGRFADGGHDSGDLSPARSRDQVAPAPDRHDDAALAAGCPFYRIERDGACDNPDQRLSQDIGEYVRLMLSLSQGFVINLGTLGTMGWICAGLARVCVIWPTNSKQEATQ